jgi:NAD(P)-dependent dehydrogenase (short-subunit alcohol dehydrogenase family)
MDYGDRHVVVTGGTGALGTAVVAALIEAGATCYVPWRHEEDAQRFGFRDHKQVRLVGDVDLTDEAAVGRLFGGVPALWASIHIAGGFAMAPLANSHKADLMKQLDTNLVALDKGVALLTWPRVMRSSGAAVLVWSPIPRARLPLRR